MDFLLGVPGKLKAIIDALAAKLDATVSSRAAASTALSTATWTGGLATRLGIAATRKPVASIVNAFSAGGGTTLAQMGDINATSYVGANLAYALSGALTANTLKTMLNITSGAGVVRFLGLRSEDAGVSHSLRIKVTIDGVVVFDATTAASNYAVGAGVPVVGSLRWNATYSISDLAFGQLEYDTSFKVEIASSNSETDKLALLYNYETRA